MSSVVQTAAQHPALRQLYEPIAEELARTEQVLREEMRSRYPAVDELVRYGVLLGGKRLRPALLLLAAKAVGRVTAEHCLLGAVIEMIHTATLVHDDVLDEAETRRHLATVHCRWDTKSSVLLGDFLFTHAFYLASTLGSTRACRSIGLATNAVCEGEMRQKGSTGDFGLSEADYLDIISAKTAELCACSCELGAHYAGGSAEVAQSLGLFGRHLGTAFQIADDILDVAGEEEVTGKSLGTDLEQQKPTLPLIHLLRTAGDHDRQQALAILHDEPADRLLRLRPLLLHHGSIEYARERAKSFADQAIEQLGNVRPSPARDSLATMAQFSITRGN